MTAWTPHFVVPLALLAVAALAAIWRLCRGITRVSRANPTGLLGRGGSRHDGVALVLPHRSARGHAVGVLPAGAAADHGLVPGDRPGGMGGLAQHGGVGRSGDEAGSGTQRDARPGRASRPGVPGVQAAFGPRARRHGAARRAGDGRSGVAGTSGGAA